MKNCKECGNQIADNASFCPNCGAPAEEAPTPQQTAPQPAAAQPIRIQANGWTLAGTVMAALLLLATFIGLVSDSGTYFNRLYTTTVMWHLPLIAIAMLAYGIVCDKRQGCSSTLAYCGIAMLVVAFFMSNIMKNVVADAADNAQNIVKIGTNTAKSMRNFDFDF